MLNQQCYSIHFSVEKEGTLVAEREGTQGLNCYTALLQHLQSRIKPALLRAVLGFATRTTCASGLPWVRNMSSQLRNVGAFVATRYWAHISNQELDQRSPVPYCILELYCLKWSLFTPCFCSHAAPRDHLVRARAWDMNWKSAYPIALSLALLQHQNR